MKPGRAGSSLTFAVSRKSRMLVAKASVSAVKSDGWM